MIIDLFTILVEEPEKRKKLFLFICRVILNVIIASNFYRWTLGDYDLISFTDIKDWVLFFVTGRVLICALYYLVSDFLFFHLVEILTDLVLMFLYWIVRKWIIKPLTLDEIHFYLKALDKLGLIKIEKRSGKLKVGKHTDGFRDFIKLFVEKESIDGMAKLKNSLTKEILDLVIIFNIVFNFGLPNDLRVSFIETCIFILLITLPFLYLTLSAQLDFLRKNAKGILNQIDQMRMEKIFYDTLKDLSIHVHDFENIPPYFCLDKYYTIHFELTGRFLSKYDIEFKLNEYAKYERALLVVTNKPLTNEVLKYSSHYKSSLLILSFENEEQIPKSIEELILKK